MAYKRIKVDGHQITVKNADKLFFPEDGYTKWDMVEYYRRVAPFMLPYMRGRTVTMLRMVDGIHGESFYQKDTPGYFPGWIKRVEMPKENGVTHYLLCEDESTLAYLAAQACITPHLWLSRADNPRNPDMLVFDLDPSEQDFEQVREAAFWLKDILSELSLPVYVKTTGSRGVHVVMPLDGRADYNAAHAFALEAAHFLSDKHPRELTVEQRKDKRKGRVFIDILRNSYAQTAVAPYALRAIPGAPVAAPVTWDELKSPKLQPQSYNMKNIFQRLDNHGDPWSDMWTVQPGSINELREKLKAVIEKRE
jgi:bifunctional non-homologous end joining protein LigD